MVLFSNCLLSDILILFVFFFFFFLLLLFLVVQDEGGAATEATGGTADEGAPKVAPKVAPKRKPPVAVPTRSVSVGAQPAATPFEANNIPAAPAREAPAPKPAAEPQVPPPAMPKRPRPTPPSARKNPGPLPDAAKPAAPPRSTSLPDPPARTTSLQAPEAVPVTEATAFIPSSPRVPGVSLAVLHSATIHESVYTRDGNVRVRQAVDMCSVEVTGPLVDGNELATGDLLVEIDGTNVMRMPADAVAALLQTGEAVKVVVARRSSTGAKSQADEAAGLQCKIDELDAELRALQASAAAEVAQLKTELQTARKSLEAQAAKATEADILTDQILDAGKQIIELEETKTQLLEKLAAVGNQRRKRKERRR